MCHRTARAAPCVSPTTPVRSHTASTRSRRAIPNRLRAGFPYQTPVSNRRCMSRPREPALPGRRRASPSPSLPLSCFSAISELRSSLFVRIRPSWGSALPGGRRGGPLFLRLCAPLRSLRCDLLSSRASGRAGARRSQAGGAPPTSLPLYPFSARLCGLCVAAPSTASASSHAPPTGSEPAMPAAPPAERPLAVPKTV